MKLRYSLMIFFLTNALLLWQFVRPLEIVKQQQDKPLSKACLEPKFSGLCRGKFLRYAYDNKTKSCVSFNYSGCGANQNNFLTYEECRRECITQERY